MFVELGGWSDVKKRLWQALSALPILFSVASSVEAQSPIRLISLPCGSADTVWQYTLDPNCSGALTNISITGSQNTTILNPPALPHTVTAGDTLELVYSTTSVQFDTTRITLTFVNAGVTFDTTITVLGSVLGGIRSMGVILQPISAAPGDTVLIYPGVLVSPQTPLTSAYSYTIMFDRTLLDPIGIPSTDSAGWRMITVHDTIVNGTALAPPLKFIAGLGDSDLSLLIPADIILGAGCIVQTDYSSSVFSLNGVCIQGGSRLIDPTPVGISNSIPNPAHSTSSITVSLAEQGPTTVALYDASGKIVKTLYDGYAMPGVVRLQLDVTWLATGAYYYLLATPSQKFVGNLLVTH